MGSTSHWTMAENRWPKLGGTIGDAKETNSGAANYDGKVEVASGEKKADTNGCCHI